MVVAKVEFGEVAVQVLLAAVLVDAAHPALEQAPVPIHRVRVDLVVHVLAVRMADRLVAANSPPTAGYKLDSSVISAVSRSTFSRTTPSTVSLLALSTWKVR